MGVEGMLKRAGFHLSIATVASFHSQAEDTASSPRSRASKLPRFQVCLQPVRCFFRKKDVRQGEISDACQLIMY